jgi:60 kDa SS-A/Ro ribonucleoprotein
MSKFNQKSTGTKTVNLAGGEAFQQSPELELISILLTSFANDQFYRSENETYSTLSNLIEKCDRKFVAQAAIYARTKFGMRSITHVTASILAPHIRGLKWAKDFYNVIVYRPDDMMEIISLLGKEGKLPNAMKKGFAKAFDKFDAYQLAKYKGEGKECKLVDIVNLVHPIPIEKNAKALSDLIKGVLKSTETWEAKLSKAGQTAKSDEEKVELKKEAWTDLIKTKKIAYFALLKNLRNIIEQAPEVVNEAISILTDEKMIKKSLVLPFRFITAFEEIENLPQGKIVRDVLIALNKAIDISVNNVPKFKGETLVVLDTSSSMQGKPSQIGSLFSAVLVKASNCDMMTFDYAARYINFNPLDSTVTISKGLRFDAGGTNFHSIFLTANKKYDRVIILSDQQGWVGHYSPSKEYLDYKRKYNADPFIYSFDLQGYGNMQFPERNVFCLAGFSDKVFDIMKLLEQDKHALVNEIKKVQF